MAAVATANGLVLFDSGEVGFEDKLPLCFVDVELGAPVFVPGGVDAPRPIDELIKEAMG